MNRKALFLSVWSVWSVVIFSGCAKENPPAPAADIKIKRVISTAPANTDIILGLGLGERLVAVDRWSKTTIDGVDKNLPEVDFFYPDIEAILALDPDIIISHEINNFGAADSPYKPLRDLGIQIFQRSASVSIAAICADIRRMAAALNVPDRGEALAADLEAAVDKIAQTGKTLPVEARKKVYFEVMPAPDMVTLGSGSYLDEMITLAGGHNIFAGEPAWFSPSAEAVIERDPEVIFTMAMVPGGESPVEELRRRRGFEHIAAVREGRIYAIDANAAGQASQHIVLALRQIAQALSP